MSNSHSSATQEVMYSSSLLLRSKDPPENLDLPLNIFQVPGFVPNRITEAMERDLEGDGTYLDQSYLYWEP